MGVGLGILFDCFRVARIILPHTTFFVILEDILFFFLWSVSLVVFSLQISRGEVRFYYVIGNILGFTIYYFTVGKVVVGVIKKIVLVISKIFKFFYKILIKPIVKLVVSVCQIVHKLFVTIYSKFKKNGNGFKIHLKKNHKMMYNKPTRKMSKKEVKKLGKNKRKKTTQRLHS